MLVAPDISPGLEQKIGELRDRIMTDPVQVLDPPDQHHQFSSKVFHGRKLDMDNIPTGSEFFWQWVATYAEWINEARAGGQVDALVGIANGANRLAPTMAPSVGATGLETVKVDSKTVRLSEEARFAIQNETPKVVRVIEDVGTTGGTTSTVVPELRELGVENIEVFHTWIRNPELPKLDAMGVPYSTVIHEPLDTFSVEDCRNLPEGFCNQGIRLIPHEG